MIVFNAGDASYVPDQGQPEADRISRHYAAEIGDVLHERNDVSMMLMPHDHREVVQEHQLLRSIEAMLELGFSDRVTSLLSHELRAREVKAPSSRSTSSAPAVCTWPSRPSLRVPLHRRSRIRTSSKVSTTSSISMAL